jgi:phosphodiesterase/alkaline phosphatase D-like protein
MAAAPGSKKPTKAEAGGVRVPELLQWKDQEMADDMSALMRNSQSRGAKKVPRGEQEQKKRNGEARVPELLQWKDQEMADDILKLMAQDKVDDER